jgi:hypothetical protein
MTTMTTVSDTPSETTPSPEVQAFLNAMDPAAATLVILRDELYDGCWDDMEADLRARLEGRPYIFKLAHRIVDDLDRIRDLRQFELDQQVNLGIFIRIEP